MQHQDNHFGQFLSISVLYSVNKSKFCYTSLLAQYNDYLNNSTTCTHTESFLSYLFYAILA